MILKYSIFQRHTLHLKLFSGQNERPKNVTL